MKTLLAGLAAAAVLSLAPLAHADDNCVLPDLANVSANNAATSSLYHDKRSPASVVPDSMYDGQQNDAGVLPDWASIAASASS
jgi:hypothetical protein